MSHLRPLVHRVLVAAILTTAPAQAQKIVEYTIPTSSSGPDAIATGPDGRLWFCENFGNNVGAITTNGAFDEYAIPTASAGCSGITYAAIGQGLLFYSENNTGKVGFMNTTGSTFEFLTLSHPFGLADGHDGRLWIVEQTVSALYADQILTGAVPSATYSTVTSSAYPYSVVLGPDGRMWMTEFDANKIGACPRSDNPCVEYSIPTTGSQPYGITASSDGNLYFTEHLGNKIGRITPGGTVVEFTIPTASSSPSDIVAGPGGNIWFAEIGGNKIGRMTPAGVFTEYAIPTEASLPLGIALGPDGNIWFCENGGNKIGKLRVTIPGDVNDDGAVNVADVFYLINFLFAGGPAPK